MAYPASSSNASGGSGKATLLSPLLFVLAAELIQVLVNKATNMNLLKAPIPHEVDEFPIIQYVDDTVLVL